MCWAAWSDGTPTSANVDPTACRKVWGVKPAACKDTPAVVTPHRNKFLNLALMVDACNAGCVPSLVALANVKRGRTRARVLWPLRTSMHSGISKCRQVDSSASRRCGTLMVAYVSDNRGKAESDQGDQA